MNDDIEVLVTGGTGFIGRWLLAELSRRGRRVAALVRDAEKRGPELLAFVARLGGDPTQIRVLSGDIETEGLGLTEPLAGVRDVYHLAARFSFGMRPDEARRANVEGAMHVAAWARARPQLRRFVYLGGYRMTRPSPDLVGVEAPFSPDVAARLYRAHGAYEASKHESYLAVQAFAAKHAMPWTAVHPSTVIGDARTGLTTQCLGLGETVEQLFQGTLPALVGSDETFVPVVTVDYLASMLATVPEDEETANQELTVLDPATPTLSRLLTHLAAHLGVPAPRWRVPVGLLRTLPRALTGVDPETLGFLSEDRYDTTRADAHAARVGLTRPDVSQALERWCDELVSTRFGRVPDADRGRLIRGTFVVGDPRTADIVFLHGLPWNGDAWRGVSERVKGTTCRVDLPGLGRSQIAADDVAWLDALLEGRTQPVVLVGHSLGARLAVRYAAQHREKVKALVLAAPAFLQARMPWMLRIPTLVAPRLRAATEASFAERILEAEASEEAKRAIASAVADLPRGGVASVAARALSRAAALTDRAALATQLASLPVPTTLVIGARDPLLVPHGDAPVVVVEGAGHHLHVTHPDEVAAVITDTTSTRSPLGDQEQVGAVPEASRQKRTSTGVEVSVLHDAS